MTNKRGRLWDVAISRTDYHRLMYGHSIENGPEPEDTEEIDRMECGGRVTDEYLDLKYPSFEPEIIYTMAGKEYFLPALKVLKIGENSLESPSKHGKWMNMELRADCQSPSFGFHAAPAAGCVCGIYGSVNMDEIYEFLNSPSLKMFNKILLCVIEPYPEAEVHLCRKGWKASHAFVSEVVGHTISVGKTSDLLSLAWQRSIDIRRAFQ